ncbi:deoxyguanosinetriphosphate triphosphohydrolase [Thermus antranikianii]
MLYSRERLLDLEAERLAPYAQKARDTRGRKHPEPESPYRTPFQKDRDRILHTTAFRRLEYKTQVFPNWAGDYYRTRLTHTLEVVQVARSIARALGLNEDLTEAIALSHDLGHPPFGHTGEKVLNELMRDHGGFEHNAQALRILTQLEVRYPGFKGLNLTHEVLEGIATHEAAYAPGFKPEYEGKGTLEAQVVDLSDAIAYAAHDLDDGLRSGLLRPQELTEVPFLAELAREEGLDLSELTELSRRILVRQLLGFFITASIEATHQRVEGAGVRSPEEVRRHPERLAALTPEAERAHRELKAFLMERFYRHPEVLRERRKAEIVLENLFRTYTRYPELLPKEVQARIPEEGLERAVCDYIAGMTDRYALEAYRKLFP